MNITQAREEARRRFCSSGLSRPCVWRINGKCAVGYIDAESGWRFTMGVGESWEFAFASADENIKGVSL